MPLRLLSTGSNGANQLGHSGEEDVSVFTPCTALDGLVDVRSLAFGANHSVGLLRLQSTSGDNWEVWGTGDGRAGQLGPNWTDAGALEGFERLEIPAAPVKGLFTPTHVACGWTTTFIAFNLSDSSPGTSFQGFLVLAMGSNDFSELGSGVRGPRRDLPAWHWHVFDASRVVDLKAGPRHAMVVLQDEQGRRLRVMGWGASRHGQVLPPGETRPAKLPVTVDAPALVLASETAQAGLEIVLGFTHSAIREGSDVYLLGVPSNAALLPLPWADFNSIQSTWHHLIYRSSTSLTVLGRTSSLNHSPTHTLPSAIDIVAAGSEHLLVLSGGDVLALGWNEHGNLGDGTTENKVAFKVVWRGRVEGRVRGIWAGCGTSWILVED